MGNPQVVKLAVSSSEPKPERRKPGRKPGSKPAGQDLYTMTRDLERKVRDLETKKLDAIAKYDLQIEEAMKTASEEVVQFMNFKNKLTKKATAAE